MFPIDLSGKNGIVFGVANDRSIAWGITQALSQAGARIALTYQGDRLKERVEALASTMDGALVLPCDATDDDQIAQVFQSLKDEFGDISFLVHSIAFANREDLDGRFVDTGRDGFRIALEVSAYSLLPLVRHAAPLMTGGGSVVAMTFDASLMFMSFEIYLIFNCFNQISPVSGKALVMARAVVNLGTDEPCQGRNSLIFPPTVSTTATLSFIPFQSVCKSSSRKIW